MSARDEGSDWRHRLPTLETGRLLECVVTSQNADGGANVAPMGPLVDPQWATFLLRPYRDSKTFDNLQRTGQCVAHLTDDVLLIAKAALNLLEESPRLHSTPDGAGWVLSDACRWYSLQVEEIDASSDRAECLCRVLDSGRLRDFVGFNRAMHAVIEATILATRLAFLPKADVQDQLQRLSSPVRKTAGPREREAFALVQDYVEQFYSESVRCAK